MFIKSIFVTFIVLLECISNIASAELIKIMSFNIHHSEQHDGTISTASIADKIITERADIIVLQEVDDKTKRTNNVDQLAQIAKLANLKYYKFGAFFDYDGGQYGMGIISRYPIIDSYNIPLPDGPEPRTSLMTTVNINGKKLNVIGVHLYRSLEERILQAQAIVDYVKSSTLPLIVTGDFNTTPTNSSPTKYVNSTIDHGKDNTLMQYLTSHWTRLEKIGNKVSFPSGNMWDDDGEGQVEIDHTFIKNLDINSVKAHYLIKGIVSDHRPLITEISW